MLASVCIKKLFGLYTYTLDMKSGDGGAIRFITGPNGYGKTAILNILSSLYAWDLRSLSVIPFDSLKLSFDDSVVVEVRQKRFYTDEDTYSDLEVGKRVELHIGFSKGDSTSSIIWNGCDKLAEENNNQASLYFKAHPVYYIRDRRLRKGEFSSAVKENAADLRTKMKDCLVRINEALSIVLSPSTDCIEEGEYNAMRENLREDIDVLVFCGLLKNNPLPPYDKGSAGSLRTLATKVSDCVNAERQFIKRLHCFCRIAERSDFADKHLQLSPQYGYRFRLDDENGTIILPDNLSSGEQHVVIMTYELLFVADDASLVLVDEPELSFHPAWQLDFLNNLRDITSLRNLQCIVCTHSPQVFGNDFSLSVDLYEQSIATISE